MNQFLQANLFTIIVFLLLIILILIGVIAFVVIKLLSEKSSSNILPAQHPTIPPLPVVQKLEPKVQEKFTCHNHPDQPSVGSCLICEDVYCENCLVEHESMFFCKQHFKTYANHKWKQVTDFRTSPHNPEEGMFIYNFKRKIWNQKEKPSFIITHYKINVEDDLIESYIQLNVREEDADEFTKGLSDLLK